jgi:hypothetical protein
MAKLPVDSAAPDGRCGQHGDGLAEVEQRLFAPSNEPVPELPTATLDKPSAAFGLPTGAWTSRRWIMATSFRMEGAGLPTLPTGTSTTIFLNFKDQRRARRGRSPTPSWPSSVQRARSSIAKRRSAARLSISGLEQARPPGLARQQSALLSMARQVLLRLADVGRRIERRVFREVELDGCAPF